MSAAHVRRGGGRARPRARAPRVAVPRKLARRIPVDQASANRIAGWAFALFAIAIAIAAAVALDLHGKAGRAIGEAMGNAGFRVRSVDVEGLKRMDPAPVYRLALDEKATALPLVDVGALRQRLLGYGWIKDARVSRRFPDTLVIDVVERTPAALWQDGTRLSLVDAGGVVLGRVPVSQMPDLPLLSGAGANEQASSLGRILAPVPTMKTQMVSANWIGGRRWDLAFQSGETVMLPEGEAAATTALTKFAHADKASGLLGRGIVRFDLRLPGKMTVRLPRAPGDPIVPAPKTQS